MDGCTRYPAQERSLEHLQRSKLNSQKAAAILLLCAELHSPKFICRGPNLVAQNATSFGDPVFEAEITFE